MSGGKASAEVQRLRAERDKLRAACQAAYDFLMDGSPECTLSQLEIRTRSELRAALGEPSRVAPGEPDPRD